MNSTQEQTANWYKDYYQQKGLYRNDLLRNPEVLFQKIACENSILYSLRKVEGIDKLSSKILDVGCGTGSGLLFFSQLGFLPQNLYGIDILDDRIKTGRRQFPFFQIKCGDASAMQYESEFFDIVHESTMFIQITDRHVSNSIAEEMLRVLKPGGYILVTDWCCGKPGSKQYKAVSLQRVKSLFNVGIKTEIVCRNNGALIPPIGRRLSRYAPALYFIVQQFFPFLVGLKTTMLRKSTSS